MINAETFKKDDVWTQMVKVFSVKSTSRMKQSSKGMNLEYALADLSSPDPGTQLVLRKPPLSRFRSLARIGWALGEVEEAATAWLSGSTALKKSREAKVTYCR